MHVRFLLRVGHKCISRNGGLRIGDAFLHWVEQQEPKSVVTWSGRLQINLVIRKHLINLFEYEFV